MIERQENVPIETDVTKLVTELRSAAGPDVPIRGKRRGEAG